MKKIISKNSRETQAFAKKFAQDLKGGEIICLWGDLGAGKTTFAQGLAQALGVNKNVTSPTFVVMKIYDTNHKSIKKICHIDAYRIGDNDLETIGAQEYFNNEQTISIIEWPENIKLFLNRFNRIINLKFKHLAKEEREISLE